LAGTGIPQDSTERYEVLQSGSLAASCRCCLLFGSLPWSRRHRSAPGPRAHLPDCQRSDRPVQPASSWAVVRGRARRKAARKRIGRPSIPGRSFLTLSARIPLRQFHYNETPTPVNPRSPDFPPRIAATPCPVRRRNFSGIPGFPRRTDRTCTPIHRIPGIINKLIDLVNIPLLPCSSLYPTIQADRPAPLRSLPGRSACPCQTTPA